MNKKELLQEFLKEFSGLANKIAKVSPAELLKSENYGQCKCLTITKKNRRVKGKKLDEKK